jgi:hypothetical protein
MDIHDAEIARLHGYGKAIAKLFYDFVAKRA